MKKLTFLFGIAFCMAAGTQAQSNYKSAIGGRFGEPVVAFSYKQFISKPGALEFYAGVGYPGYRVDNRDYNYNSFTIGGMYQHHFPIGNIPGFKWYVGGGVLASFYDYKDIPNRNNDYAKVRSGLNAVGGVDYKVKSIPLNLSADIMPTIYFADSYTKNFRPLGGVAVRYTIN